MNKQQFFSILRQQLKTIPEKELADLLEDYEHHFTFAMQSGKTEEEICQELGHPAQLAQEMLNEYYRTSQFKPVTNKASNKVMASIGLFFLNFVLCAVPLGLSIWAVWLSLAASSIALALAPFLAGVDFFFNRYFSGGILFASLIFSGLGILIGIGSVYLGVWLKKLTISYFKWNVQVYRGGQ